VECTCSVAHIFPFHFGLSPCWCYGQNREGDSDCCGRLREIDGEKMSWVWVVFDDGDEWIAWVCGGLMVAA